MIAIILLAAVVCMAKTALSITMSMVYSSGASFSNINRSTLVTGQLRVGEGRL